MNRSSRTRPSAVRPDNLWRSVLVVAGFLAALYTVPRLAALLAPHPATNHLAGYLAITPVLVVVYRRGHRGDTVRHLLDHRRLITAATLASVAGGLILYQATTALWPESPSELPRDWGTTHIIMGIFSTGIGAGICEEIAFRGYLQAALDRRLSRGTAVILTSLAFGAAHLLAGYRTSGFIATTADGLVLGWVFAVTGSVWPAIGVHVAHNLLILGLREAPAVVQALVWAACTYLIGGALLQLVHRPSNR